MTEEPDLTADLRRGLAGVMGNIGWLSALALTFAVAAKVSAAARLDPTTAVGLVAASDKATIVLGLPGYALWSLVPYPLAVAAVILALLHATAMFVLRRRFIRRGPEEMSDRAFAFVERHLVLVMAAFLLLMALAATALATTMLRPVFDDRMWLPAEVVTLPGGERWTGYLVSREGDTAVYLRDDDRRLVRLPATVADTATYCTPRGVDQFPPLSRALSGRRPATPACP